MNGACRVHPALVPSALPIACHPCYHVTMIRSFKEQGAEDIFYGRNTKEARRSCPQSLYIDELT